MSMIRAYKITYHEDFVLKDRQSTYFEVKALFASSVFLF